MALENGITPAVASANRSIASIKQSFMAFKTWVGGYLVSAFAPFLETIAYVFKRVLTGFPRFLSAVINGVITALNTAGKKIVDWLNSIIMKLNIVIKGLQKAGVPVKTIGLLSDPKQIGAVEIGDIGLGLASAKSGGGTGTKGDLDAGGGGGGGSALAGGGGGAGAVGRAGVAATAPRANVTGESAQTLTLIELARVQGQEMHELLETLKNMPTMIRDAIIVYTGGVA
jgi:hypothetical protein